MLGLPGATVCSELAKRRKRNYFCFLIACFFSDLLYGNVYNIYFSCIFLHLKSFFLLANMVSIQYCVQEKKWTQHVLLCFLKVPYSVNFLSDEFEVQPEATIGGQVSLFDAQYQDEIQCDTGIQLYPLYSEHSLFRFRPETSVLNWFASFCLFSPKQLRAWALSSFFPDLLHGRYKLQPCLRATNTATAYAFEEIWGLATRFLYFSLEPK